VAPPSRGGVAAIAARVRFDTGDVAASTDWTSVDAIDSHRMSATLRNPFSPIAAARSGRSIRNSSAAARASAVGSETRPLMLFFTKYTGSPESRQVTTGLRELKASTMTSP
jgi:hypothetical protein